MPIKKEQFISQLAQQLLNSRVSLFLGAGGSRDAGYPSWSDLFKPCAEELGIPIDETTDYYQLAQFYSNNFGQATLRQKINERINRNNSQSNLLNLLIDTGFTNIWTTNFDNAVEFNYRNRDMLINKIFRDADFSNVDLHKRVNLFKMNGDITNLDGVIATQSDFESYADTHRMMLMFFKRELISSTFLFIGYSFKDHLVLSCMSELTRYLGDTVNHHYTIMKNADNDPYFEHYVKDLEQRYHIHVLLVDQHEDINNILKELNQRIRDRRVFVSGSFSSYDEGIEEYSHKFSKQVACALLSSDYRIVNGIGRRFGTHLIGYANEYLAEKGVKNTDRHLIIRPFVGREKDSDATKRKARERVIGQCGAAIFLFGENHNGKSGVMEEYEIARQQRKIIIPIAYPGTVSEIIWYRVKDELTKYPYLEKVIDMLNSNYPLDKLSELIVHILESTDLLGYK